MEFNLSRDKIQAILEALRLKCADCMSERSSSKESCDRCPTGLAKTDFAVGLRTLDKER